MKECTVIHYYDPDAQNWKAIENPSADDIAAILAAAANNRPCASCDADVDFRVVDGGPVVAITHTDDCPHAA